MTKEMNVNTGDSGSLQTHGILEELNIPPQIIRFIRQNARNLQIGFIAVIVAVLLALGINAHQDAQRQKTDNLLFKAMNTADLSEKNILLQQLYDKYPSSDAGLWALLELAHSAQETGNINDALAKYEQAADKINSDNPLFPLLLLTRGQMKENSGNLDEALAAYVELTSVNGFLYAGKTGQARIYEVQKNWQEAGIIYQDLEKDASLPFQVKQWLAYKTSIIPTENNEKK